MTVLDQSQAWDRSYELVAHEELGNSFRHLSNTAYMAVEWLEYSQSKLLTDVMAQQIANDLESAIKQSLNNSRPFDRTVAEAMPAIKMRVEDCVKACVNSKQLLEKPYYFRVHLAANTIDVVGRHLEL